MAKANADAMELPELNGTPKQVAWATTIRQKFNGDFDDEVIICRDHAHATTDTALKKEYSACAKLVERAKTHYMAITSAKFWINNRSEDVIALVERYAAEVEAGQIESNAANNTNKEVKAANEEMTVAPVNRTHSGAVEIRVSDADVCAFYQKDDDFRKIVKSLDYAWDPEKRCWAKKINVRTGTASERAAELGNKLLNSGFAVTIADNAIRSAAINGDYEPQTYRWIVYLASGKNEGMLFITWGRDDNLYKAAKAIHGARYSSPGVVVSPKEFEQIEDFAYTYGFKISDKAKRTIGIAKQSIITVSPSASKDVTYEEHPVSDILNTPADVLPDLIDD